jgi:serralysin
MTVQQNRISELYSDASGTIQFIELNIGPDGSPDWWKGVPITSSRNGITNILTIDLHRLPPDTTLLLATQAFADRSGVTPNFIIPDRFLFSLGGTLQFGNVDAVDYPTLLSADSRTSVARDGTAMDPSPRTWQGITAPLPEPLPPTDAVNDAIKAWNALQTEGAGAGHHMITGSNSVDTVVYPLARSAYTLRAAEAPQQYVVEKPGMAGTDTLASIERLQFSDMRVALDMYFTAGQVAKVLGAVFGREAVHNKVWAGMGMALAESGMYPYHRLAEAAMQLSGKTSPADIVALLWTNLVGSPPTEAEAAPYLAEIDDSSDVGLLVMLAAEHPLNLANIDFAGLAETGLEYVPYTF